MVNPPSDAGWTGVTDFKEELRQDRLENRCDPVRAVTDCCCEICILRPLLNPKSDVFCKNIAPAAG
jgi:hypothetical protein